MLAITVSSAALGSNWVNLSGIVQYKIGPDGGPQFGGCLMPEDSTNIPVPKCLTHANVSLRLYHQSWATDTYSWRFRASPSGQVTEIGVSGAEIFFSLCPGVEYKVFNWKAGNVSALGKCFTIILRDGVITFHPRYWQFNQSHQTLMKIIPNESSTEYGYSSSDLECCSSNSKTDDDS
ncbi:MAG: hypothetical protein LBJ92_03425 [Holosporales bacterium]|nr:hypothetical protein [Holosporales bacterium]